MTISLEILISCEVASIADISFLKGLAFLGRPRPLAGFTVGVTSGSTTLEESLLEPMEVITSQKSFKTSPSL